MPKKIRRREFWGMTAAGMGVAALLRPVNSDAALLSSFSLSESPTANQWDYQAKPVKVTNPDLEETWNNGSHFAFDGYGGSRHSNSIAHGWFQEGTPSEQKPLVCTIDYGEAVTITKFVHYFYVPSVTDYRTDPFLLSTAFESLRIYRSENGTAWALAEQVRNMSRSWPQVITLSRPDSARHYKLEVTGLIPGASGIRT